MSSDPRDWIAASQLPGVGPATLARLAVEGYSPTALLEQQLPASIRLRADTRHALRKHSLQQLRDDACRLVEHAGRLDIQVLSMACDGYPSLLRQISDPPPVLWLRGDARLLDQPQLAVVGSRKPSVQGVACAIEFAASLAKSGFVITSGLAQGVDTAAHQGALRAGRSTLAVLGSSPELIYPRTNQALADQMLANGGLLVSEFPPGTRPRPEHFPRRNRIISGLSVGTLVIEAALRSGSLITARLAMDQGREVFAIPGSIHNPLSKGCHALIREGAWLVENQQQICEPLAPMLGFLAQQVEPESAGPESSLTADQQSVLQHIRQSAMTLDQLHAETGMSVSRLQQLLINFELDGKIASHGDRYMALC